MIHTTRLTLLLAASILAAEPSTSIAQQSPSAAPSVAQASVDASVEAKLIAVLQSDAPYKAKSDACRALVTKGTRNAVPALSALLGDEKLNHMARYALEEIQDPSATVALRQALNTTKGLPLIGVINSVGSRRDAGAIAVLAKLLSSGEAGVADAAATSLGRIGTAASARTLRAALAKPTPALYDAILRCAQTLPRKDAAALLDTIRKPPAPPPIRMAALGGAILARGEQGVPLIVEALRGNDYAQVLAAIQAARDLRGVGVTRVLSAEAGKLSGDRQILLLQVLGDRRDKVALPQLMALAKKSQDRQRATAVKAIVQIGDVAALPLLAEMASAEDVEVAGAARAGLANFKGREVEAPIFGMLQSTNPRARSVAAELISHRKMSAVPQLLRGAADANPAVASANIRALGEVGGSSEIPALLQILTSGSGATSAAENALSAIYARNPNPSVSDALVAALPQAPTPANLSLMRVLRRVGGSATLPAMRAQMLSTNPQLREGAMRIVGEWPTADALPDLLAIAKAPPSPTLKVLALRGFLRLVWRQGGAPEPRLAALQEARTLSERPEEKRLVLEVLAAIPTAESLTIVVQDLASPALKLEASLAAVAIAEQLVKTQPTAVGEAMKLVVNATDDKPLIARAQAVIAVAAASPRTAERRLFNGQDLSGWEGVAQLWSVRDGAITGQTTDAMPADGNTFLVWKDGDKVGQVGDFELSLKYKILDKDGGSAGGGNSGIQYRSKVLDSKKWVVGGYQADFEVGKSYSGILYEEQGRGILAQRGQKVVIREGDAPDKPKLEVTGAIGTADDIQAAIKPGDWNDYRIVASGNRLQHFINGKATIDVTDETAAGARNGVLALQLHAGPPMTVQFKDIVLKVLP